MENSRGEKEMIEIPVQYLLNFLAGIAIIGLVVWTALGLYCIGIKEHGAGIVVLCSAAAFWLIALSMLEIVVWV